MPQKGHRTCVSRNAIEYTIIDHREDIGINQHLPEENETVMWWYWHPDPPYVGTMCDLRFPGIEHFFAWSTLPTPPEDFFKKYNPEW